MTDEERIAGEIDSAQVAERIAALEKRVAVLEAFLRVILDMEHTRHGLRTSEARDFDRYLRGAWEEAVGLNKKRAP